MFKLGYKMVLICVAQGSPAPEIKWYRDGFDLAMKKTIHVSVFAFVNNKMGSAGKRCGAVEVLRGREPFFFVIFLGYEVSVHTPFVFNNFTVLTIRIQSTM